MVYDVLIIGGGIYGASIAWEAAHRGLSVALVEKNDFASGTSSNSLRIVHGGLRYLQHGDLIRMRESIRERSCLLRIAPHLIDPLRCVFPTYRGQTLKAKGAMRAALRLNDAISYDRNDRVSDEKRIPAGRVLTAEECLRRAPGLRREGLGGGVEWTDAVMWSSERMVMSFLLSARREGARLLNYTRVTGFLRQGNRVVGVTTKDVENGYESRLVGRIVINASGPWINEVLKGVHDSAVRQPMTLAFNVLIRGRRLESDAVAAYARRGPVYFLLPWRSSTLVGTCHLPLRPGGTKEPTADQVRQFIAEVNAAYPGARLTAGDVERVFSGLLPGTARPDGGVRLLRHYRLIDHEREDGVRGLVSVVGVKFTTARDVAERTVDLVFRKLGRPRVPSRSSFTPLWGGETPEFLRFLRDQIDLQRGALDEDVVVHLVRAYGTMYRTVLDHRADDVEPGRRLSVETSAVEGEVLHAVRNEMAKRLEDVVFRRMDLEGEGGLNRHALDRVCAIMARARHWTPARLAKERAVIENRPTELVRAEAPAAEPTALEVLR